jgi:hypothetical protein
LNDAKQQLMNPNVNLEDVQEQDIFEDDGNTEGS